MLPKIYEISLATAQSVFGALQVSAGVERTRSGIVADATLSCVLPRAL